MGICEIFVEAPPIMEIEEGGGRELVGTGHLPRLQSSGTCHLCLSQKATSFVAHLTRANRGGGGGGGNHSVPMFCTLEINFLLKYETYHKV